ncbi:MAG TPA: hypothetical protein VJH96_02360 [Patescibacteria group bacterium]|nr:hypothetical protein [Patescibacteria group bacterium]
MDRKKEKKQKVDSLDKFLKLVIIPIEKLYWREIDEFRRDWQILGNGFIEEKKLKNWYNTIQKIIPKKKYNVVYYEHEIVYEIEDGKIVNMIPLDYFEKYPRILELGNKLEAVFDYEVRLLMNKFNLDYEWAKLFKQYLLFGRHSIKFVRSPNFIVSERICVDENGEEVDHKFSFNASPNTPLKKISSITDRLFKDIRNHTQGYWLGKKRNTKSKPILEKLINLETTDQKRNIRRSNTRKSDLLFGNLVDDPRFSKSSDEDFAKEDTIRIKKIKNLRRHYPKLKPSQ